MRRFIILTVGLLLATVLQASPPSRLPETKPDQGLVIIFREKRFYGSANTMQVYADDGVALPRVRNGSLVHHYFPPGDHRLYADRKEQRDARVLGVEAGRVYFFEARFAPRAWHGADVELVPVTVEEGFRRFGAAPQHHSNGPMKVDNPVLGKWRWNSKDGRCPELHEYRPDGTATVRSGGEVLEKTYTIERYKGGPYFLFHEQVTASNGGKDCQGKTTAAGKQSGMFVLPTNDGGYYTCSSNEGWGCFGTASASK